MLLISLAMIVKNEEATLAHCLESVKPLADEMVIVDTGSTDKTIEIAKGFGAKVYHFDWCDDFSAARNESLKHCTGDWVLILDADEAIDPLDYEKITNACINPFADAYNLVSRNYMPSSNSTSLDAGTVVNTADYSEGKGFSFFADNPCLRLARVFDGLSFSGRIHESIGPSILAKGKALERLDAVIHHYGKLFSDRVESKIQYYFELARQDAEKKPTDEWALFNLTQQALVAGRWETALGAAQSAMHLHTTVNTFVLYGAGLALQELGRHEEATNYFGLLLNHDPEHAMATLRKGYSAEILGDVESGRKLIARAIELSPGYIPGYGYLAELEIRATNLDRAREIVSYAIGLAPDEPYLYSLLIKIELTRNNHQQASKDAMSGMQRIPNGGKGLWHRLAFVFLLQSGELESARSILNSGLEAFPDDPELIRLKGFGPQRP